MTSGLGSPSSFRAPAFSWRVRSARLHPLHLPTTTDPMRWLVKLCLDRKWAVAALTLLALAFGGWGALQVPLDVFPEFVPPSVSIQTEAPGFAPEQVEQLITKPLENSLNGATGVATLRSESIA